MSEHNRSHTPYIGRFAPSPTGELHLGSLVSALASYFDSRYHKGRWLIRIEDIDPPREIAGASQSILESLKAHGLHSDKPIIYQSQRLALYQHYLQQLAPHCYPCYCTRGRIRELGGVYDGHCKHHSEQPKNFALRLRTDSLNKSQLQLSEHFIDNIKGPQHQPLASTCGDFIIQRKDTLVAYQLAVTVDDIEQGITHVIRGDDLLDSTARQRYLFLLLGQRPPEYGHIPVVLNEEGQKLSKQHHAPPLDNSQAFNNVVTGLKYLQMAPPEDLLKTRDINQLLTWGATQWPSLKL